MLSAVQRVLLAGSLFLVFGGHVIAQQRGQFQGALTLKVLPDDRLMSLVSGFNYIDSHGVSWPVPAGTIVDGASIPRVFWTIFGAPFTGLYRDASVVHDYYCQLRTRLWKAVHKVFYDGMIASGVDPVQAELMYLAVYRFGPRWDFDVDTCYCEGCPQCAKPILKRVHTYQSPYNKKDFAELEAKIKAGASPEVLENIADFQINTEILEK